MIKIQVTSTGLPLVAGTQIPQAAVQAALRSVAVAAERRWHKLASERLHSSREAYARGMQRYSIRRGSTEGFVLELVGTLANMVERGWEATDLRNTLLQAGARGVKQAADGSLYRSVPFRHTTPGSGPTTGAPMGSAYSGFPGIDSAQMGKRIYAAARQLQPGQSLPEGLAPKLRDHHTTDIYAGMRRLGAAGHTQYVTWRTISTAVARGWQHPGIEPRKLLDIVQEYVTDQMPKAFQQVIQASMPRGRG